jgi:hypothetical protein
MEVSWDGNSPIIKLERRDVSMLANAFEYADASREIRDPNNEHGLAWDFRRGKRQFQAMLAVIEAMDDISN